MIYKHIIFVLSLALSEMHTNMKNPQQNTSNTPKYSKEIEIKKQIDTHMKTKDGDKQTDIQRHTWTFWTDRQIYGSKDRWIGR